MPDACLPGCFIWRVLISRMHSKLVPPFQSSSLGSYIQSSKCFPHISTGKTKTSRVVLVLKPQVSREVPLQKTTAESPPPFPPLRHQKAAVQSVAWEKSSM